MGCFRPVVSFVLTTLALRKVFWRNQAETGPKPVWCGRRCNTSAPAHHVQPRVQMFTIQYMLSEFLGYIGDGRPRGESKGLAFV